MFRAIARAQLLAFALLAASVPQVALACGGSTSSTDDGGPCTGDPSSASGTGSATGSDLSTPSNTTGGNTPDLVAPSTMVGNPIDLAGGNKYRGDTDLRLPGPLGLMVMRHYNSQDAGSQALGIGWRLAPDASLRLLTSKVGEQRIAITEGDGRARVFTAHSTRRNAVFHSSAPDDGVVDEDENGWHWHWSNGRELRFTRAGALSSIDDHQGQRIELGRDRHGRLMGWRDQTGRAVLLEYQGLARYDGRPAVPTHRLIAIHLPGGGTLRYDYDDQGQLSKVTQPDGRQLRYRYQYGHLVEVLDGQGIRLARYDYDSAGRAIHTERPGGIEHIDVQWGAEARDQISAHVISAEGQTDYQLKRINGEFHVTRVQGAGCPSCAQSNASYDYDAQGRYLGIAHDDGRGLRIQRDKLGRITDLWQHSGNQAPLHLEHRRYLNEDDPQSVLAEIDRPSVRAGEWQRTEYRYDDHRRLIERIEKGWSPDIDMAGSAGIASGTLLHTAFQVGASPNAASIANLISGRWVQTAHHWHYCYDLQGRLVESDDPIGAATRYRYDASGQVTLIERPEGLNEIRRYDSAERLVEVIPADGVPIRYDYDANGRVVHIGRAGQTQGLSYSANGHLSQVRYADGGVAYPDFDQRNRLIGMRYPDGHRIQFDYTADGNMQALQWLGQDGKPQIDPIRFDIDPHSGERRMTDATGGIYRFTVDAEGRLNSRQSPGVAAIHYRYGQQDQLSEISQGERVVSYLPQGIDVRSAQADKTYPTLRDDFGNLIAQRLADGDFVVRRVDANGHELLRITQSGKITRTQYDSAGRPLSIDNPARATDPIELKGALMMRYVGAYLVAINDANQSDAYRFDGNGRLIDHLQTLRAVSGDNWLYRTRYDYDSIGRLASETLPNGHVLGYRYGSMGRVLAVTMDGKALARNMQYYSLPDGTAYLSRLTYGNGLLRSREFDHAGQMVVQDTEGVGQERLGYDQARRLVDYRLNDYRLHFDYDELGRLKQQAQTEPGRQETQSYPWDAANNRLGVFSNKGYALREVVDTGSDRLLSIVDTANRPGAQRGASDRRLLMSSEGQVLKVLDNGQQTVAYRYNYRGERIARSTTADARYYLYENQRISAEIDTHGRIVQQYVYVADGAQMVPLARIDSDAAESAVWQRVQLGQSLSALQSVSVFWRRALAAVHLESAAPHAEPFYLHSDWRAAPVAVTNQAGAVVWRGQYDAWGNAKISAVKADFVQNLRLAGQYADDATGLYNNYLRDYDPRTGRYLSADPAGLAGGLNGFAYVNGDPVNRVDVLGTDQSTLGFNAASMLAMSHGASSSNTGVLALAATMTARAAAATPPPPPPIPLYGSGSTPSYGAVVQGGIGDCWFLSAVAEIAIQNPGWLKSIISNANADGTYNVTLPGVLDANGQPTVLANVSNKQIYFATGSNMPSYAPGTGLTESGVVPTQNLGSYVTLLENAAIKFYGGIQKIDGGWPMDSLGILTGQNEVEYAQSNSGSGFDMKYTYAVGGSFQFNSSGTALLPPRTTVNQSTNDLLLSMANKFKAGAEEEVSTVDNCSIPTNAYTLGLVPQHAYAIAGFNYGPNNTIASVILANPWGRDVYQSNAQVNANSTCPTHVLQGNVTVPALVTVPANLYAQYIYESTISTPAAPKSAPTAAAGNGQAIVTFTASPPSGGAAVTGYVVQCIPPNTPPAVDTSANTLSLSHTITGLTNGKAYTCTVTTNYASVNNVATPSTVSPNSNVVIPHLSATVPTITSITAAHGPYSATPNSGKVAVTVDGPAKNAAGSPSTGYAVNCTQAGVTPPPGGAQPTVGTDQSGGANQVPSTHLITGLTNGTPYTCAVTETFADGTTQVSAVSSQVTPITAPDAPTLSGLVSTSQNGVGSATVTVNPLTPAQTGGSPITGYSVTCNGTSGNPPTATPIPVDTNNNTLTNPHTITGLVNGATYNCWAQATNNAGTSLFSSSPVGPLGPINVGTYPPPVVRALPHDGAVWLTFPPPPGVTTSNPVSGYTITTNPGNLVSSCTAVPCIVDHLQNGVNYTFTVQTISTIGTGVPSAPVSATPVAGG